MRMRKMKMNKERYQDRVKDQRLLNIELSKRQRGSELLQTKIPSLQYNQQKIQSIPWQIHQRKEHRCQQSLQYLVTDQIPRSNLLISHHDTLMLNNCRRVLTMLQKESICTTRQKKSSETLTSTNLKTNP